METNRLNLTRVFIFLLCFACLIGISACVTFRRASAKAPFVINFQFLEKTNFRRDEGELFRKALAKYTMASATRVSINGKVVWPPPHGIPPVDKMKTTRVMKAGGEPGSASPSGGHVNKTDHNPQAAADDSDSWWDLNRPTKTDYLSFACKEALRGFFSCIAEKGCPDVPESCKE